MNFLLAIFAIIIILFNLPAHYSFILGLGVALTAKIDSNTRNTISTYSKKFLQLSIILLGAKLDLQTIFTVGKNGIFLTSMSILSIFFFGHWLAKIFKVHSPLSTLITSGTSICGGSAISAVSPVVKASSIDLATSMGVVFLLNAIAIFIFPTLGRGLSLSQEQFGLWAALAIHDTSSVVAATQLYGEKALEVGTTLKLLRSLWIIPVVMLLSLKNEKKNKVKLPLFILGFLGFSVVFSTVDELRFLVPVFSTISKVSLSIVLFSIGLTLSKEKISKIGVAPFLMAFFLWFFTIITSYFLVQLA